LEFDLGAVGEVEGVEGFEDAVLIEGADGVGPRGVPRFRSG
jgi:hypothetical protein